MRLSVLYREPLANVLQWPASHVRLITAFLAKEPTPEQRIELAVAKLEMTYVNAHKKSGTASIPFEKFLLFRDAWKAAALQSGRYTDAEKQTIATLMSIGRKAA